MKSFRKIKLPILFFIYLYICWHYGSAYMLNEINPIRTVHFIDLFLIAASFGLIIAVVMLSDTKFEKLFAFIFSIIMLLWNIIYPSQLGSKNFLNQNLLELFYFLNSPGTAIVLKSQTDIKDFHFFTIANALVSLIPFIIYLFTTTLSTLKLVGPGIFNQNKQLIILVIICCSTLRISIFSLSSFFFISVSAIHFACWVYTIFQYRNNLVVTKFFFFILSVLTIFYIVEIILFQISDIGNVGSIYLGIYFNEVVIGPILLHYINLFPAFTNQGINFPELICIILLLLFCTSLFCKRRKKLHR